MQNFLPNFLDKEGTRALLFAMANFPTVNTICYCTELAVCDILLGGKHDIEYYLAMAHNSVQGYISSVILLKCKLN